MKIDNGNIYACDSRYETIYSFLCISSLNHQRKGKFLGSTLYKSVSKKNLSLFGALELAKAVLLLTLAY